MKQTLLKTKRLNKPEAPLVRVQRIVRGDFASDGPWVNIECPYLKAILDVAIIKEIILTEATSATVTTSLIL